MKQISKFLFVLSRDEIRNISQFVPCSGLKHAKRVAVFTEQGVAMLSGILNSDRAIEVNIAIMRTFVKLRQMMAEHADLARKIKAMEKKYDEQFQVVFDAVQQLIDSPEEGEKGRTGFQVKEKKSKYKANKNP